MGRKFYKIEWPDWPVIEEAGSEWQAIIHHLGYDTEDDLREKIEFVIRIPEEQWARQHPHAYSDEQLDALLRALAPRKPMRREDLRRATDQFAAYVGTQVKLTRQSSPTKRAEELRKGIIAPTSLLRKTLGKSEVRQDLLAADLHDPDIDALDENLRQLEQHVAAHTRLVELQKRSGRKWDHELCKLHVYMAALLTEFINPSFDPSRGQRFDKVVHTLAKPIIPPSSHFKSAIREHAEMLRSELKKAKLNPRERWLRTA